MGDSTRGQSPGPSAMGGNSAGQSAVSYDRRIRLSRTYRDNLKGEKDFIPLVEIKQSPTLDLVDKGSDWPLESRAAERTSQGGLSIRS